MGHLDDGRNSLQDSANQNPTSAEKSSSLSNTLFYQVYIWPFRFGSLLLFIYIKK
jgi:hypothetical protein